MTVAGIYLLLRRLCMLCLFSRIRGRGKGSKCTCCLECIYFITFGFLQGAYITEVRETHPCVQRKALACIDSLRHGNGLSALLLLTRAAKSSAAKSSVAKTRSIESGLYPFP